MNIHTPRILFLLLAVLQEAGLWGRQRPFSEAYAIAAQQAQRLGITMDSLALPRAKALHVRAAGDGKPVPYYVIPHGADRGFTIVSGDDRLPAIVGYSDRGTYADDSLPEAYRAFLQMYRATVEAALRGEAGASDCVAQALRRAQSVHDRVKVAPLLGNIRWAQGVPYNQLCPVVNGKDHALTGCVATAMAQVMAYWKYPDCLKATIPAYTTRTKRIFVPAIWGGAEYDWDNMLGGYTGDYTEEQALAVATLMHHCGAAVGMDYTLDASGANVTASQLATYFGYDADLMMNVNRSVCTLDEWCGLLDAELKAGRPVLYSGFSSYSGHEFVCDGADGQGFYHINWGWGGQLNGYFDITILHPGDADMSGLADGFSHANEIIVGIQPDNKKVDEPLITLPPIVRMVDIYGDAVSIQHEGKADGNGCFSVSMSGERLFNYNYRDLSGFFAYGVRHDDGTFTLVSEPEKMTIAGRKSGGTLVYSITLCQTINYAFPVGRTTVCPIYSADGNTWQPCRYIEQRQPVTFEVVDGRLRQVSTGPVVTGAISATESPIANCRNTFALTLTNHTDREFEGVVDVYSSSENVRPSTFTEQLYMVVPAHSTATREFSDVCHGTDHYMWAKCNDSVLVNQQHFAMEVNDPPVWSLVSAETNAEPDLYESEQAYYHSGYRVTLPKTKDAEAVFTYGIKNTGGTSVLDYVVSRYICPVGALLKSVYGSLRVEGNGGVAYITVKAPLAELNGNRSVFAKLYEYCPTEDDPLVVIPSSLPERKLYVVGGFGSYFEMSPHELYVYVSGDAETGLEQVPQTAAFSVQGGRGELVVASAEGDDVVVYAADGRQVCRVKVAAGSERHIPITPGLYIVNGRKVVVR